MRKLLALVGSVVALASSAAAQPMMCGNGIIQQGDSQLRVLELCGYPENSRSWMETIPAGDDWQGMEQATQMPMAEWLYQNDPDQFAYRVVFQNGIVSVIKNTGM
jgi:hypothetical protein